MLELQREIRVMMTKGKDERNGSGRTMKSQQWFFEETFSWNIYRGTEKIILGGGEFSVT